LQEEQEDCKNNLGGSTTNGLYKIRFVVNGKERVVNGLHKKNEWQL
jgi:hypothetical protein